MSRHTQRIHEAATRFEPAVRTTEDGAHYGVVYRSDGMDEGWSDQARYADRATAFVAACAHADRLAEELVGKWEEEERTPSFFDYAANLSRAHAAQVMG